MTIDTPFPGRPATPFWSARGRFGGGMGDAQTTAEILNAVTAGTLAANQVLQNSGCPIGTVFNPATYTCQPGVMANVQASGSSGLVILLAVGALLFFMGRR